MPRILSVIAALVLLATAAFHATGHSALADELGRSQLTPFFQQSLPGIWLFFSCHLVTVAFGLGWVALRGSGSARPLLIFLAAVVCLDTLFVLSLAGLFAGTLLLSGAALFTIIAAIRWPAGV